MKACRGDGGGGCYRRARARAQTIAACWRGSSPARLCIENRVVLFGSGLAGAEFRGGREGSKHRGNRGCKSNTPDGSCLSSVHICKLASKVYCPGRKSSNQMTWTTQIFPLVRIECLKNLPVYLQRICKVFRNEFQRFLRPVFK